MMKPFSWIVLLAALAIAGCGSSESQKVIEANHVKDSQTSMQVTVGDYELGAPIAAGNVSIVPVMYTKDVKHTDDEITLAEAKKLGLVEIIEIPGEQEVNKLRVHNMSDRPLLLLGGELLLGGKQDRIVAHDVIIPPGETMNVDVDCVERGRWEGASHKFYSAEAMVPHSVREAAVYEDQEKVWENVGGYNQVATAGAQVEGTTVQIGLKSKEVTDKVNAALPTLAKELEANGRAVGMIYVLNGEIVSMDLFGNPKTFQASKKSLLHSYLSDGAVAKGEAKAMPANDVFKKFLDDALNGKRETKDSLTGVVMVNGVSLRGNEITGQGRSAADEKSPAEVIHGSYSNRK